MAGAYVGTNIIFLLPEDAIQKAITIALPVIALVMVLRKTNAENVILKSEISKKTIAQALVVGLVMGFYNATKSLGSVIGSIMAGFLYGLHVKLPFFVVVFAYGISIMMAVGYPICEKRKEQSILSV